MVLFIGYASFPMTLLLMAPLVADGFLQLLTPYESKNYRRLITGILFGVAFVFFLIYYYRANIIVAGTIVKWFIDPAKVDKAMEQFLWQTGQICLTTLCI